jgi:uncharacterized membrane protein
VMLNRLLPPPITGLVELFGVLGVLAVVCAVATALGRRPGDAVAWGWWLVVVGVGLVWAPELVTIVDRMNMVFKLHLQAHLLLGAALGGLLAATLAGVGRRKRAALGVVAAAAIAVGIATTVADLRAIVATRRVPGPRPTLDGVAYLEELAPGQAAVLRELAAARVGGTVIEPPGTPYSDSMRVPMFTGLPGLVGWEYHLWQRDHSWAEIFLRYRDLDVLRGGVDGHLVAALARRYRVAAACEWDGEAPALAALPGWRVARTDGTATLSLGPAGTSR